MAEDNAVLPPCMALYESGLSAYRDRDFEKAADLFEQALQARDADQPARMMLERCRDLLRQPPGEDWDATNTMQAK
jgi:adenylate cyclase